MRGQGIGPALAARVTEALGSRSFATSSIGWTRLVSWYGRLGYQPWRAYHMAGRIEEKAREVVHGPA